MRTLTLLVLAAALVGAPVYAQEVAYPPLPTLGTVESVAHERMLARRAAEILDAIFEGVAADDEDGAIEAFDRAVASARLFREAAPGEAEAHFLVAAALGYRLELAGVRQRVRMAGETKDAALRALELDPDHPGAHHIMGRLHGATMRLNAFVRFVATRVLGADLIDGASWEMSELHLARARDLEPYNPRHSAELGQLYFDTGRPDAAIAEWVRATRGAILDITDERAVERSLQELRDLGCDDTGAGCLP